MRWPHDGHDQKNRQASSGMRSIEGVPHPGQVNVLLTTTALTDA
jgi:hypothetical protein